MTKKVRVENADVADYVIVVAVQDLAFEGEGNERRTTWVDVRRVVLTQAANLCEEYLSSGRRLVVEEMTREAFAAIADQFD